MKLSYFMAKIVFLLLFITSVILILFPLKNRGNNLYTTENERANPYYITEYKNRFFYHDFFGRVVFVDDIKIPNIPIINFSDDINNEIKIVRNIEGKNNIIKIDFLKNEIICYNKVRIKYYKKEELTEFFKANFDLSNIESGNYLLINEVLIKED
ncbi:MAG: hypothetical protein PWQ85_755 [Geotoga sp.]|nr:hypothetical protein [Geotoga sp.]